MKGVMGEQCLMVVVGGGGGVATAVDDGWTGGRGGGRRAVVVNRQVCCMDHLSFSFIWGYRSFMVVSDPVMTRHILKVNYQK